MGSFYSWETVAEVESVLIYLHPGDLFWRSVAFLNVDLSVQILIRGTCNSCIVPYLCKLFKCVKRVLDLRKQT